MPLTTYGRQHLGDHATGKTAWTKPTALYAGLYTADPGDAGSHANEATFTGYARVEVTSKFAVFNSSGVAVSTSEFNFGTPSTGGQTVTYIGYSDAASAGNMIFKEALPQSRVILAGALPVKINAGQATIQLI